MLTFYVFCDRIIVYHLTREYIMKSLTIKNLGITFNVGETYDHPKWGEYKVISINGDKLKAQFSDKTQELTAKIQAQFLFNKKCENKSKMLCVSNNEENIAWTLGLFAVVAHVEAEVGYYSWEKFVNKYESITGDKIENCPCAFCCKPETWKPGSELRLQFPLEITNHARYALPDGVAHVIDNKGKTTINRNRFWWHIVEKLGFRLSAKGQDIEKIKNNMPKEYQNVFMEGVEYGTLTYIEKVA